MPGTPPHLRPVPIAGDSREGLGGASQLEGSELQAVPKWVSVRQADQFSSSFREDTGIVGRQWFWKALGHTVQGLGVDRLLASNLGLSGPYSLKVGIPRSGPTVKSSVAIFLFAPTACKKYRGTEGPGQGPRKPQVQCWPGCRTSCSKVQLGSASQFPLITFSTHDSGWEGPGPRGRGVLTMVYYVFLGNRQNPSSIYSVGKAQPRANGEFNTTLNPPAPKQNDSICFYLLLSMSRASVRQILKVEVLF